jgi:hypothetical protein
MRESMCSFIICLPLHDIDIYISFTLRPLYPQVKSPPCTHWILGRGAHSVSGRCGEEGNLFSFCGNRTQSTSQYSVGCWTFRLHKCPGNSWLAEKPSASHEGVCFMRLASYETSAWKVDKAATKCLELRILEVPISDLDWRPTILSSSTWRPVRLQGPSDRPNGYRVLPRN